MNQAAAHPIKITRHAIERLHQRRGSNFKVRRPDGVRLSGHRALAWRLEAKAAAGEVVSTAPEWHMGNDYDHSLWIMLTPTLAAVLVEGARGLTCVTVISRYKQRGK